MQVSGTCPSYLNHTKTEVSDTWPDRPIGENEPRQSRAVQRGDVSHTSLIHLPPLYLFFLTILQLTPFNL